MGGPQPSGRNELRRRESLGHFVSVGPNAPYRDRLEDGGTTLIYDGHDQPRNPGLPNPKLVDQLAAADR